MNLFEKVLFKALLKILSVWQRKPLRPPTARECKLIEELRAILKDFSRITQSTPNATSEAKKVWSEHADELLDLLKTKDPRTFLRWDVITKTMFVGNGYYIQKELTYLKKHQHWKDQWMKGIEESQIGCPSPFVFFPKSSGNLIHHAYHLSQFEDKTGEKISDCDMVFEFGGGYGSLCRLFYQVGFKGKYVIFDLPPLSALQVFYLKLLELDAELEPLMNSAPHKISCLYNLQDVEKFILKWNVHKNLKSVFIATWSISEIPLNERQRIFNWVTPFNFFLISYQHRFGEVNNHDFFTELTKKMNHIQWLNWGIDHLPGNYYLIGKKKEKKDL